MWIEKPRNVVIFRQTAEDLRTPRHDLGVEQQVISRREHLPDTLQQLVLVFGEVFALIYERILCAEPLQIRSAIP
jgi:hypothetical protein